MLGTIEKLLAKHDFELPDQVAGYPVYYIAHNVTTWAYYSLCVECARKRIEEQTPDNANQIVSYEVNWEDPDVMCEACHKPIPAVEQPDKSSLHSQTLYKVLRGDGVPFHCPDTDYEWPLPWLDEEGNWHPGKPSEPVEGKIVPCENGLHACRKQDLVYWLGPAIFTMRFYDYSEVVIVSAANGEGKVVGRQGQLLARTPWDSRTARLFAADCAEHAIDTCKNTLRNDKLKVARSGIHAARQYAAGEMSKQDIWEFERHIRGALLSEDYDSSSYFALCAVEECLSTGYSAYICAQGAAREAKKAAREYAWEIAERPEEEDYEYGDYSENIRREGIRREGIRKEMEWQTERLVQYLQGGAK